MNKLVLFLFVTIIMVSSSCHQEELEHQDVEQTFESRNLLKESSFDIDQIKRWYESKHRSTLRNNNDITALSVKPIWNLSEEWLYMDKYPMLTIPFEEESLIPMTDLTGAKLYIYQDTTGEYTSRIIGYLADSDYYSDGKNLTLHDFTGVFYQIDEDGRIGNTYKFQEGRMVGKAQFTPEIMSPYISGLRNPVTGDDDGCYDFGPHFSLGDFFRGIGHFFSNVFESIWNIFGVLLDGDSLRATGFNGSDPVGLGPSGSNNEGGDPDNIDGFYIENGLKENSFVYNNKDLHKAIQNLASIVDCLHESNPSLSIETLTTTVLKNLLPSNLVSVFNDFVSGNGNIESVNFNQLQQFTFFLYDTHINDVTGESVNPALVEALACNQGFKDEIDDAITNEIFTKFGITDQETKDWVEDNPDVWNMLLTNFSDTQVDEIIGTPIKLLKCNSFRWTQVGQGWISCLDPNILDIELGSTGSSLPLDLGCLSFTVPKTRKENGKIVQEISDDEASSCAALASNVATIAVKSAIAMTPSSKLNSIISKWFFAKIFKEAFDAAMTNTNCGYGSIASCNESNCPEGSDVPNYSDDFVEVTKESLYGGCH